MSKKTIYILRKENVRYAFDLSEITSLLLNESNELWIELSGRSHDMIVKHATIDDFESLFDAWIKVKI